MQLRVECEYVRRFRDALNSTLTWFAVGRAVVGVSALGGWIIVKEYPLVWSSVIVLAQVADAVERAIPYSVRARGTTAFLVSLDALFIDCQMEWENIHDGKLTDEEIARRRHEMMKHRHAAETKNLPGGLPFRRKLFALAQAAANTYFKNTYGKGTIG